MQKMHGFPYTIMSGSNDGICRERFLSGGKARAMKYSLVLYSIRK